MIVDVGKLIRQRMPDKNGSVLPPDLMMGSYELQDLTDRGVGNLYEGKVIVDKTYGHVAYGCAQYCGYGVDPWMYWDPILTATGGEADQDVWDMDNCTSSDVSVLDYFPDWGTGNHAIATASVHVITGVAPGSTTNFASGTLTVGGASSYKCLATPLQPSGPVNVQVPTDSRIVSQISSYAMTTTSAPACPSKQAGWYRQVKKIVTDQNTPPGDITDDGSVISESLGLTTTNQLNLAPPNPFAPVTTSGGGYFNDQFGFCNPLCPGSSGQTDLNETFTDKPSSGGTYTLKTHTLAYTCKGDTDNGN